MSDANGRNGANDSGGSNGVNPEKDLSASNLPGQRGDGGEEIRVQRGMFGANNGGDTSGYGGLVRSIRLPGEAVRPYGGWFDEVADALEARLREDGIESALEQVVIHRGEITFHVRREDLVAVARMLRDEERLRFEFCSGVSGVHYPEDRGRELHAVYHLLSMTNNRRIRVEVSVPDADPHIPSLVPVYPTNDWHERERDDNGYFAGMAAMQEAVSKRDYARAAELVRENLGQIPTFIEQTTAEYGSFDIPSIPALERGGVHLPRHQIGVLAGCQRAAPSGDAAGPGRGHRVGGDHLVEGEPLLRPPASPGRAVGPGPLQRGEDPLPGIKRGHRHVAADQVEDVEPIELRHLDVEQQQVGLVLGDRLDGFESVATLGRDFNVAVLGGISVLLHFALYIFLNSSINGAAHWIGYQNYPNSARNLWVLALFTMGEGLHNNHHEFPGSSRFSQRWWEIDIGWYTIAFLRMFGLARPAPSLALGIGSSD